jgi:riboflavin transporter FmnP
MAVAGVALNYFIMIPFYVKAFGMPLDAIIGAGASINSWVSNKFTFVLICVAPFNIVKGVIVSFITVLLYKRISTFIKGIGNTK